MSIKNGQHFAYADEQLAVLNVNNYQSLVEYFDESCKKYADRIAFSCYGDDLSYTDLELYSRQFSTYLTAGLGLSKGDRVAVQLPNCNQYPIAVWGILRAGLVLVNTNPLYTAREIEHQFTDSGVKAVIVLDKLEIGRAHV